MQVIRLGVSLVGRWKRPVVNGDLDKKLVLGAALIENLGSCTFSLAKRTGFVVLRDCRRISSSSLGRRPLGRSKISEAGGD